MMTRSTPPRSANLAEMPVPAPAPTIGWGRRIRSRSRASAVVRGMKGIGSLRSGGAGGRREDGEQLTDQYVSERRIVDVGVGVDDADAGPDRGAQRLEERAVG